MKKHKKYHKKKFVYNEQNSKYTVDAWKDMQDILLSRHEMKEVGGYDLDAYRTKRSTQIKKVSKCIYPCKYLDDTVIETTMNMLLSEYSEEVMEEKIKTERDTTANMYLCQLIGSILIKQKPNYPIFLNNMLNYLLNLIKFQQEGWFRTDSLRCLSILIGEIPSKKPNDQKRSPRKIPLEIDEKAIMEILVKLGNVSHPKFEERRYAMSTLESTIFKFSPELIEENDLFDEFYDSFVEDIKDLTKNPKNFIKMIIPELKGISNMILWDGTHCKHKPPVHIDHATLLISKMIELAFYGTKLSKINDSSRRNLDEEEEDVQKTYSRRKFNQDTSHLRTRALNCISSMARRDINSIMHQWSKLIPTTEGTSTTPKEPTLATIILYDPSNKVKLTASHVLFTLLKSAKKFITSLQQPIQSKSKSWIKQLAQQLNQLYEVLILAIEKEQDTSVKIQIIKTLILLLELTPTDKVTIYHIPASYQCLLQLFESEEYKNLSIQGITALLSHRNEEIDAILLSSQSNIIETLIEYCKNINMEIKTLPHIQKQEQNIVAMAKCIKKAGENYFSSTLQILFENLFTMVQRLVKHDNDTIRAAVVSIFTITSESTSQWNARQWSSLINEILVSMQDDDNMDVRSHICTIYGSVSHFDQLSPSTISLIHNFLLKHATEDKQALVRASACKSIGLLFLNNTVVHLPSMKEPILNMTECLSSIIENESYTTVSTNAIFSISNLAQNHTPSEELSKPILDTLLKSCLREPRIASHAIRGLGEIAQKLVHFEWFTTGDRKSYKSRTFRELLRGCRKEKKVQWNACHALGSLLGTNLSWTEKEMSKAINALLKAAQSSSLYKVKIQAIQALLLPETSIHSYEPYYEGIIEKGFKILSNKSLERSKYINTLTESVYDLFYHMWKLLIAKQVEIVIPIFLNYSSSCLACFEYLLSSQNEEDAKREYAEKFYAYYEKNLDHDSNEKRHTLKMFSLLVHGEQPHHIPNSPI
mmetsp:Transcript_8962/g.13283  ORF Transcript_8962/g.13283 Transcript_8962/m.13283 type:complete len:989 (+) Transcript_8962:27-2993(+)